MFLIHPPAPLAFGTSGLRGLVEDMTDLEVYINTSGFVAALRERGELSSHATVTLAGDLRPSTPRIMRAVTRALQGAGMTVENAGHIPTPALTLRGISAGHPSIMVTGSHIPFDRNGIKFNRAAGEVLKSDEPDILRAVAAIREREYARSAAESRFDALGMLKREHVTMLPPVDPRAESAYRQRYLDAFGKDALRGLRLLVYQHSAVGRDLLVTILRDLGAEVVTGGRSETFVPIDTEAITGSQLQTLEALLAEADPAHGPIDAILSTDGDSDRPLVAAVLPTADASGRRVRFLPGDLLGAVVAEALQADSAVVPISVNDAVDRHLLASGIAMTKTRIGSPYVISAMEDVRRRVSLARVVGWEANGGFLLGGDLTWPEGGTLRALPTRDAVLPMVAALVSARRRQLTLAELFARLPARFGKSGLVDQIPAEVSRAVLARFSPSAGPLEVDFEVEAALGRLDDRLAAARRELESLFDPLLGTGPIARINTLDGLRITFESGEVAHLRPSGNAPQLRIYATADSQARADAIVSACLGEPDGILRRLTRAA
jgi:phosphomannomutase